MTTQIPINSNSNIEGDDLTISQCISLINNKLNMFLIEEKNKKKELDDLKKERKNLKIEYASLLKQYQTHNKGIMDLEKHIEIPLSKISKIKKHQLQLFQQINDSFYSHLIDISTNTNSLHKEFNNLLTLLFIDYCHSPSDVFTFFKDKNGVKIILEEIENTYKRISLYEKEKFKHLKEIINDTENLQRVYPFETIIEILKNSIEMIELKNDIDDKSIELDEIFDKNNNVFIEIKLIESILKKKEYNLKLLSKKMKRISELIDCLNELQKQCKKENISKPISSNNNLFIRIKETFSLIKDIDIYPNNPNFDGLSSFTIQSEYTQSDMAFVLNRTAISKTTQLNKETKQQTVSELQTSNLVNNGIYNEELVTQSEKNFKNEEKKENNEIIDINVSICDEMLDTNDKGHQTIDVEYIQKVNFRNNYYNNNNNDFNETEINKKDSDILEKYSSLQKEEPLRIRANLPKQKILILEKVDEQNTCCSSGCSYSST